MINIPPVRLTNSLGLYCPLTLSDGRVVQHILIDPFILTIIYYIAFNELEGVSRASFPFPIVQMARTILFIWLGVLPLGLCQQDYPLWGICMLTFLLTFGFLGLEYVSIEMSDPFGVDTTDFDLYSMAQVSSVCCCARSYSIILCFIYNSFLMQVE